jgi:type III secretory pathway component EscU
VEDLLQHLRHEHGLDLPLLVAHLSNTVFLVALDTVVEELLQHLQHVLVAHLSNTVVLVVLDTIVEDLLQHLRHVLARI